MKIDFEEDLHTTFAISTNVEYQHKQCSELLWAEIGTTKDPGVVILRWEDNWSTKISCKDVEQAKKLVLRDYYRHKPYINGQAWDLKDI
jgi:hypothetical protein